MNFLSIHKKALLFLARFHNMFFVLLAKRTICNFSFNVFRPSNHKPHSTKYTILLWKSPVYYKRLFLSLMYLQKLTVNIQFIVLIVLRIIKSGKYITSCLLFFLKYNVLYQCFTLLICIYFMFNLLFSESISFFFV